MDVIQTQKNFYNQKLEIKINKDVRKDFSDEEAETELEKPEMGVLFGAAYENTYIDILENEGIVNDTEINERLMEITLGMSKEELK